jgi:hypothetical protein
MISLAPTISFHRYQHLVANELAKCEGRRIFAFEEFCNLGIRLDLLYNPCKCGRIVDCLSVLHAAYGLWVVENLL